jgi:hypothetical protein
MPAAKYAGIHWVGADGLIGLPPSRQGLGRLEAKWLVRISHYPITSTRLAAPACPEH